MEIDKLSDRDPACTASLIGVGTLPNGAKGLLCMPYPLTTYEPPLIQHDAASEEALASGHEDTDPLDFQSEEQTHSLLVAPRAYLSTDNSAAREKVALASLQSAQASQYVLMTRHTHMYGVALNENPQVVAGKARVAEAEAAVAAAAQSSELLAEGMVLIFDPNDFTYTLQVDYVNRTEKTASVAVSLPRTKGLTLTDLAVTIDGYPNTSEYRPSEKAKEAFTRACESSDKSASVTAIDKSSHSVVVKVPAWCGPAASAHVAADGSVPDTHAKFTATFTFVCDAVEATALLLPSKPGQPTYEASDFAVQPPAHDARGVVPFTLRIKHPRGTNKHTLPSRASAALGAKRSGVPTYWIRPSEDGGDYTQVDLTTPSFQPPRVCFRFVNESESDCDLMAAALKNTTIKGDASTAKVLCFAPTSDEDCVALVEFTASRCRGTVANAPKRVIHVILVVDKSGSMSMHVNGSTKSQRTLACEEVKAVVRNLHNLPAIFRKANILGPRDELVLSIVGFHGTAGLVCTRVPIDSDSAESKRALDQAANDLAASTDTGGTRYTSWVELLATLLVPDEHVALALLTDGALWDAHTFEPSYAKLKASVKEFAACAVGFGSWANAATCKSVATPTGGAVLIQDVAGALSSDATRLISKCIASMAFNYTVVVRDQVLAHTGHEADAPASRDCADAPSGTESVYEVGIGGKRFFAVRGTYAGSTVQVPGIEQVDASGPIKVEVDGSSVPRDVARALRHFDPIFAAPDVHFLKCRTAPELNDELRKDIGVYNQTPTSKVVKYTEYRLGTQHDNRLDPQTRAVVPALSSSRGGTAEECKWMRRMPTDYDEPCAVTKFERKSHLPHDEYDTSMDYYYNTGAHPVFRSLGSDESDEAGQVAVFRSCGAGGGDENMEPAPAPAPAPASTKAVLEKPTDDNVTPTFADAAWLHNAHALLPFLADHTLAHRAVADLISELQRILGVLNAAKVDVAQTQSMEDIVNAAINEVAAAGKSEDVVAELHSLCAVLSSFVMRYHLDIDINLLNTAIADGDAVTAIRRAEYLTKIAKCLLEVVEEHRAPLWRPFLTMGPVAPGEATVTGTLTWIAEDRARGGPNADTVLDSTKGAICSASAAYAAAFNHGAYEGGEFTAPNHLFEGTKPCPVVNRVFTLGSPFVPGIKYDATAHAHTVIVTALCEAM